MSYRDKRNNLIKLHEGTGPVRGGRFFPYRDTAGKLTIGYGRCLDEVGISSHMAELMFEEDVVAAENIVESLSVGDIGEARRAALVSIALNLGNRLRRFTDMLSALRRGDWQAAHDEALDSKWSRDVDPKQRIGIGRDDEIARMLLTDEWPV